MPVQLNIFTHFSCVPCVVYTLLHVRLSFLAFDISGSFIISTCVLCLIVISCCVLLNVVQVCSSKALATFPSTPES